MLVEHVNQRWAGLNLDDASVERQQRRLRSAGGSVFTSMSSAKAPEGSRHYYVSQTSSAIRLQAAAELAAKEVELKALMERERKQAEIAELQRGITLFDKENEVAAARAKLRVYDGSPDRCLDDFESVFGAVSLDNKATSTHLQGPRPSDAKQDVRNTELSLSSPRGDNTDALVLLAELLRMNRLPTAEPSVFTGDIIGYMDWKASFMALIDTRCSSSTEKMHYLRRYIGGEVTNVVENSFLQNTVEAYEEAWGTLDRRYGDRFRVAQSFRDKLHSWPRLAPRTAKGC